MTGDLHRLLVPVDVSAGDRAALDVAVRLARRTNATVTLLAIAPLAIGVSMEQDRVDRLAEKHLDKVAAGLGGGLDVRTSLGWGPAGQAIVEAATDHDLVVIPWHQPGPIGHLLRDHNHTGRQVLDRCPVPVVVVPAVSAARARHRERSGDHDGH